MAEEAIVSQKAKRGPRQYNYDPWATVSKLNASITVGELAQIAPAARSSLQHDLRIPSPRMELSIQSNFLQKHQPMLQERLVAKQSTSLLTLVLESAS
jgi:hypothetical protein